MFFYYLLCTHTVKSDNVKTLSHTVLTTPNLKTPSPTEINNKISNYQKINFTDFEIGFSGFLKSKN